MGLLFYEILWLLCAYSPVHTSCECEGDTNVDVTYSQQIIRSSWVVLRKQSCDIFTSISYRISRKYEPGFSWDTLKWGYWARFHGSAYRRILRLRTRFPAYVQAPKSKTHQNSKTSDRYTQYFGTHLNLEKFWLIKKAFLYHIFCFYKVIICQDVQLRRKLFTTKSGDNFFF